MTGDDAPVPPVAPTGDVARLVAQGTEEEVSAPADVAEPSSGRGVEERLRSFKAMVARAREADKGRPQLPARIFTAEDFYPDED